LLTQTAHLFTYLISLSGCHHGITEFHGIFFTHRGAKTLLPPDTTQLHACPNSSK